jgi:ABC-type multidrug transport system fused ATPase/permease subunit
MNSGKVSADRAAFLWSFARPWRWRIGLALLGLCFVSATALLYPWLLKLMAARIAGGVDGPDPAALALLLLVVFLISAIVGYIVQLELQSLGYRLRNLLRVEFFSLLLRRPLVFFARERAGELSARAMEDFSRLQPIFAGLLAPLCQNSLVIAGCLYFMARIQPEGALLVGTLIVIPFPIVLRMGRRMRAYAAGSTADHAEANALLEESVVGVRDIKAFAREDERTVAYGHLQAAAFGAEKRAAALQVVLNQGIALLLAILLLGIFASGASADRIAFYFYTYTLVMSAVAAGRVMLTYHGISGAFERSYQLMRDPRPRPPVRQGTGTRSIRGAIRLTDIRFAYDAGPEILRGVSLNLPAGSTLLITGASGSGKSTLVNIIAGLLHPAGGGVAIDRRPLEEYPADSLRSAIGYVGQDPVLFRGTLRENICWSGFQPTERRLREVLDVTCLQELVSSLPQGLTTVIGERGETLSGGERARVAIARAILHRPAILILDEANAMLGRDVERVLWPALLRDRKGKTTIILSHHHEYLPRRYRHARLRDGRLNGAER